MKISRIMPLFALSLTLAGLTALAPTTGRASGPSNWSQWRGPEGTGISAETDVPNEWAPDKNIKWKVAIPGRGHSSPIVWGDKVFLTTDLEGEIVPGAKAVEHKIEGQIFVHPDSVGANRKHIFKVLCLDRNTGKILWEQVAYEGTVFDDRHRKGSYAAPTPATDGTYVFAWFGGEGEGLHCYDFNGKRIWKTPIGKIATVGMGPGTSPVLFGNTVILQCDEDEGKNSFIVALDKRTGKEVWKTSRPIQASWATPLIVKTATRSELITSGNEWIIAYDPQTGKELWKAQGHGSNAIPTPLAGHGMAYVYAGFPSKKLMAIKLGGSGDISGSERLAWQYAKGLAYVPSSILYGDYVYLMTDRGLLTCLDARTGKVVYEGGRLPVPATFTGSPVAFDDKLLLTSEDGDTYIIKAGPKHEVLSTNSVGEPVYSSLAISDGMIFIRGEKSLYCIARTKGKS
ncbi:MAG TPA: PQQ-binding-like beta-propeller repeat protein [Blastocatellia bacterium]|nr:PQQ-binding-like beta-propeller repeat protein [Blastocatellia bacterium]